MIRLESLQKEDFKKIVEWNESHSAEFLLQWAGPVYEYPLTEEQLERYFDNYVIKEKDTLFVYKIINVETSEIVGTIELNEKDRTNKIGRIGRFLIGEESYRGKGTGKEALKEAIRIGFEKLKLNKITLGVFDFNISAIRCYESVGFVIEEYKENYRKIGNDYWNLYEMGITKERWEANLTLSNKEMKILNAIGGYIMQQDDIKVIKYDPVYAEDTVRMWRESKERALGKKDIHPFEDHVFFLNHVLNKENEIYIAVDGNKVAGIVAFNESEVNQLYIHIDYQGRGLGKKLLELAKANSIGRLTLYTFEVNKKAQRFYEKNGFKIIGRGYENEENLDDIKYEWVQISRNK